MKTKFFKEIVLGSLLHDIGKISQRIVGEKAHSDYSGIFADLALTEWGDDIDINAVAAIARCHHSKDIGNCPDQYRLFATIVHEADCIAASERISEPENISPQPLHSIFESMKGKSKDKDAKKGALSYRLCPLDPALSFNAEEHDINLESDYKENPMWGAFLDEMRDLFHRTKTARIETLMAILKKYTWCVTSATWKSQPDISLFEHAKLTAAIASCIAHEMEAQQKEGYGEIEIQNRDAVRYLFACGDLSGIQNFIYTIRSKEAAKTLRGRSFFVQLLVEACARCVLREFGLYSCNLVYSSGGRFYVLLPRSIRKNGKVVDARKILSTISLKINSMLLSEHHGALSLSIASIECCGNDLAPSHKTEDPTQVPLWAELSRRINARKKEKFKEVMLDSFESVFCPPQSSRHCAVCGAQCTDTKKKDDTEQCRSCALQTRVGERLVHGAALLAEVASDIPPDMGEHDDVISFPALGAWYVVASSIKECEQTCFNENIVARGVPITLWNLNHADGFIPNIISRENIETGYKFIEGIYTPRQKNGGVHNFNTLAELKKEPEKLGVLRMDVDGLGLAFKEGFGPNASFSRSAQLSFMLDFFFSAKLDTILEAQDLKDQVQIVYSGGDDIFLVGHWDAALQAAACIREGFIDFTAKKLTISAGVSVVNKTFPIASSALFAKEALESSKAYELTVAGSRHEKDAVTFFGVTLSWHDFKIAEELASALNEAIEDSMPSSIIGALSRSGMLYHKERDILRDKTKMSIAELSELPAYTKWRWRLIYALSPKRWDERNTGLVSRIQQALIEDTWNGEKSREYIVSFIQAAAYWADLKSRSFRKGGE